MSHITPQHPKTPHTEDGCWCFPRHKGELVIHADVTPIEAVERAARRWGAALVAKC